MELTTGKYFQGLVNNKGQFRRTQTQMPYHAQGSSLFWKWLREMLNQPFQVLV